MPRYFFASLLLTLLLIPAAGCSPEPSIHVDIVSPPDAYVVQNGSTLHALVRVTDSQNRPLDDAVVTATVIDPAGHAVATLSSSYRGDGTYASAPHDFPIGSPPGTWRLEATARENEDSGTATRTFTVDPSRAERLQAKYGFWLDDFDFFHCHGSDSFIAHEVEDPDEGHVVLEEHCSHMSSGDQIHIGVFWSQRAFPATEEDARAVARASLPPFFVAQITASTRVTFQGRNAWQMTGTFHNAEESLMHGVVEWMAFQCPDDDHVLVIVTSATRNVQAMLTDELSTLRDSFRCPSAVGRK